MKRIVSIEEVRAREADPQHDIDAQKRLEIVRAKLAQQGQQMNALANNAIRERRLPFKIMFLRQITDILGDAMKGVAPCTAGCSACCHQPVMVHQPEAELIAMETKAPLARVKKYTPMDKQEQYIGQTCPFLVDGGCSIYASRPLACRLHYSLDADDLLCHLFEGESISVPYFNPMQHNMLTIQALGLEEAAKTADIREFFPRGRG